MASKFRTRWQKSWLHSWWVKIKLGLHWLWQKIQKPLIVAAIIVLVMGVLTLSVVTIVSNGIGINGYTKTTTTVEVTATPSPITAATATPSKVTTTEEYQPGKTLWDLLQLLIIPLILAIGGFWLNQLQKSRDERSIEQRDKIEHEITVQRDKTEREIAADNQREAALQAYLDKMSELLLHEKLRTSAEEDEVRKIARVRTLTVLRGLDPIWQASVIQFLYEAALIDRGKRIVSLKDADLRGANFRSNYHVTNLGGVDLSYADLFGADLSYANLQGAYLTGANLEGAKLHMTDLSSANISYTELPKADLSDADLTGADLRYTSLSGANLHGAKLSHTELAGDVLCYVILSLADLSDADLTGADLRYTKLWKANLKGAKLSGANLEGANLEGAINVPVEELKKQVASLQGATMPDGSKHS